MKNLFKSLMLVAVAAMAFTACTETNEEVNAVSKSTTITFTADFGDTTRVAITDEDNDGKYKSSWEAGDQVVFAVYPDSETDNYYPVEVVGPFTIEDNCDRAEFTVTFSEIAEGNEIRAFLNYTFYNYLQNGYVVLEPMYISSQCPLKDTFENVCASAEVTYAGQEFNALQFSHDFAYAKMTINNLPTDCAWVSVNVNNSRNYSLDPENVENGVFWFMCDECLDVKSLDVTAAFGEYYSDNYRELCFSRTFGDEDDFEFKKGKISKFTITQLLSKLDSPYVTSVVNGNIATITWEAVNGADKYYVTVGDADAVEVTGTSYAIDLSEYEPLSTLSVYVVASGDGFANSNRSSVSVKVPASREYLDTWANDVEEFTFMRAVTSAADGVSVNNAYLFTKSEMSGKPTKGDFFMYLAFNNNVDFTQSGVYTINDLNYAYCNIWMPDNQLNGYSGYYNNYGLSWMPYHFYPNDGDIYQVFVDADGEETTITLYASCSWWSSIHFKGTWTGKLGGSVEPEPEPEEDPETIELIYASATPAPAHRIGGTGYNVTFLDSEGNEYFWQVQTLGNNYLEVGEWNGDIAWGDVGHVAAVEWPGVRPWPYIMNVAVVDNLYEINLQVTDYVGYGGTGLTHTAHFKGNIVGMTVPGVEPEPVSSASAVLVTDTTFNGFNPYDVTFSFANGDKVVVRFNTSGNKYLHLGEWQANDWQKPHYISLVKLNGDEASISACNVAYENNAYTVAFSVYEYKNYTTIDYTYTGAIGGLNAPEACDCFKESDVPNTENLKLYLTKYAPYSGYCDIVFGDSEGKNSITLSLNDCPLVNNTYTVATSSDTATSPGTMYLNGCFVEYLGHQSGTSAYLKSGSVDVKVNDGVYTIKLDLVLTNDQVYSGVFEGEIK